MMWNELKIFEQSSSFEIWARVSLKSLKFSNTALVNFKEAYNKFQAVILS